MYAYTNILGSLKINIVYSKRIRKTIWKFRWLLHRFENDSKEKKVVNNITNIIFDRSIKIGDGMILVKVLLVMIMSIKIGHKTKVKNSIVGNNNKVENKENILITIIITIFTGIIVGGIIYYLGWN